MPFCSRCGAEVMKGEFFCEKCGTRIRSATESSRKRDASRKPSGEGAPRYYGSSSPRTEKIFEGNKHTCRHCGALIDSFTARCPDCGAEIRDTGSSPAVERFYEDLLRAGSEEKKISLIRAFPFTNSMEDICEFMYLAASNFDAKLYIGKREGDTVQAAWYSKIEQCFHKAQRTFPSGPELESIRQIYSETQEKIQRAESSRSAAKAAPWLMIAAGIIMTVTKITPISYIGVILLIFGIIFACSNSSSTKQQSDQPPVMPIQRDMQPPQQEEGFSSWSGGKKAGWVLLNVYTLGIPALIRGKKK